MKVPRCVILYSVEAGDLTRQRQILALADRLNADGVDAEIDMYHAAPPEGWPRWMEAITEDRTILYVCGKQSLVRFSGEDAGGEGGAQYEARLVRQRLVAGKGVNSDILPIVLAPPDTAYIPPVLRDVTHYDVSDEQQYEKLYAVLTGRELHEKPSVGEIRPLRHRSEVSIDATASIISREDAAYRERIAVALERLLTGMRRLFIKGQFVFGEWQHLHDELVALMNCNEAVLALPGRYAEFSKALDHDQFSINYGLRLAAEFKAQEQKFAELDEREYKREVRYHDAQAMINICDVVQTFVPFMHEFGRTDEAQRLEYLAVTNRAIAERTLQEPPS